MTCSRHASSLLNCSKNCRTVSLLAMGISYDQKYGVSAYVCQGDNSVVKTLAMDLFLSFIIFYTFGSIFLGFIFWVNVGGPLLKICLVILAYLVLGPWHLILSTYWSLTVPLLATFVSSLWLYVCALSWTSFRLGSSVAWVMQLMKWALPVRDRPVRAIGEVAAVIASAGYIAVSLLGLL